MNTPRYSLPTAPQFRKDPFFGGFAILMLRQVKILGRQPTLLGQNYRALNILWTQYPPYNPAVFDKSKTPGMALLKPDIAFIMVARPLPKPRNIRSRKFQSPQPLCALPEVHILQVFPPGDCPADAA